MSQLVAGTGPRWAGVLVLAKQWKIPPWEVEGYERPSPGRRWLWRIRANLMTKPNQGWGPEWD